MSSLTTVKITKELRDRLNDIARAEGATAGSVIERLLDDYIWRTRMEDATRKMAESAPEVRAEYLEESQAWEQVSHDGLSEYADDSWPELH